MPSTVYPVKLQVVGTAAAGNGHILKTMNGVPFQGNFVLTAGDKIAFSCTEPFAFFLTYFSQTTTVSRRRRIARPRTNFPSPFSPPGLVHCTDNGSITVTVNNSPRSGYYTYVLAVEDGAGGVVTVDPQIIIQ